MFGTPVFFKKHSRRLRYLRIHAWTLCLLLWLSTLARSQDSDLTLEVLQQQLADQASRIAELESLDQNVNAGTGGLFDGDPAIISRLSALESNSEVARELASRFLESPSTESLRRATGRLHLDYWGFPQTSPGINEIENGDPLSSVQDRLELRRIRIGVRGSVPPGNATYQLDLEFAGVDQIGIRDAWISIDDLQYFDTVRIGNQKRPYSLAQLNSSNFTVFIERPFIAEAVNDPNRRVGVQSLGATDDERFNWRYGVFNLVPIDETGFISSNSYQTEIAGRLASTIWRGHSDKYIHLGVSTSFAFPSDNIDITTARFQSRPEARTVRRWLDTGFLESTAAYQLLGAESVYNFGSLQVGTEYMNVWLQRLDGLPDLHFHGGYVYVSHFLTGEHIPWNRAMGILGRVNPHRDFRRQGDSCEVGFGAWQWALRASLADFNDEDVHGGYATSLTFALNWYWNSHTRMQFNYTLGEVQDRDVANGTPPPALVSGDYQITGGRFMVDF